jgi:hypothetical protein
MGRLLFGLIVGVAGGAAVSMLNVNGYTLVAPLVALAAGLALGVALGWGRREPSRALGWGLVTGGLAGLLIASGQLAGVWQALASPRAPDWLRGLDAGSDLFWLLAGGTAVLCLLLAAVSAGALAGVVSAWTGFHPRRARPAGDRLTSLLPGVSE